MSGVKSRVVNADYHRNGVAGEGFYVGLVETQSGRMLITVFPERDRDGEPDVARLWPRVAVVNVDRAHVGMIRVDQDNAWRGDRYGVEARAIVAAVEERHTRLFHAV